MQERESLDLTDPILSFGVVVVGRLSKINQLSQLVAEADGISVVTSRIGARRTLWLVEGDRPEKGDHPEDVARRGGGRHECLLQ